MQKNFVGERLPGENQVVKSCKQRPCSWSLQMHPKTQLDVDKTVNKNLSIKQRLTARFWLSYYGNIQRELRWWLWLLGLLQRSSPGYPKRAEVKLAVLMRESLSCDTAWISKVSWDAFQNQCRVSTLDFPKTSEVKTLMMSEKNPRIEAPREFWGVNAVDKKEETCFRAVIKRMISELRADLEKTMLVDVISSTSS